MVKNVPYSSLIRENEVISIPSIFMFHDGCEECMPFLYACKKANCTVLFENEDIIVRPSSSPEEDFLVSLYLSYAKSPTLPNHYMKYLNNYSNQNIEEWISEKIPQK